MVGTMGRLLLPVCLVALLAPACAAGAAASQMVYIAPAEARQGDPGHELQFAVAAPAGSKVTIGIGLDGQAGDPGIIRGVAVTGAAEPASSDPGLFRFSMP